MGVSILSYRYEEDFDALLLGVHCGYSDTLLAGFLHLHPRPDLCVEDHTKTSLSPHDCKAQIKKIVKTSLINDIKTEICLGEKQNC